MGFFGKDTIWGLRTLLLFLLLIGGFSTSSHAIVFGNDDRVEIYKSSRLNQEVSPSIAVMVSPVFLQDNPLGFLMDFPSISDSSEVALCKGERFYGQPSASVSCTGFLVASNLLITAGHCMTHYNTTVINGMTPQCSDFKWAFDYKYKDANTPLEALISPQNLASCTEVIYANFMYEMKDPQDSTKTIHGEDVALIKLDRHFDRPGLKIQSQVKSNETVSTVGHPTGLPQKATLNGRVLDVSTHDHYFTMNLDVFGGNSGSPILNTKHEAIGVIVRAFPSLDYIYSEKDQCSRPNRCSLDLKTCNDKDEKEGTVMYSHGQIFSAELLSHIKNQTIGL